MALTVCGLAMFNAQCSTLAETPQWIEAEENQETLIPSMTVSSVIQLPLTCQPVPVVFIFPFL